MKMAPLLRQLATDSRFLPVVVHTGQHYDDRMSGQFFRDLGMPEPAYSLGVGSGSHAQQTAAIMVALEPIVLAEKPAAVIVVGDVNSTVAAAIVAAKLGVLVIHVEAGLRSFDRSMPEEINRILTDAITNIYLVSEESGRENLLAEGVRPERIKFVGNLMIDSLHHHLARARESGIVQRLGLSPKAYGLVTLHRPANVDHSGALRGILTALSAIASELPLYFPAHPRTHAVLEQNGLCVDGGINVLEPLGYVEFLGLMDSAAVVLTDSGGIQEETTALGVPCLTLRENTERPVTVEQGSNMLAGVTGESILAAWAALKSKPESAGRKPALWDGRTAERCLDVFRDYFLKM